MTRIEDIIQQKEFQNEYGKLTVNLMYTHSWLSGIQQKFFKPYDLSQQQYNILRILRGQKGKPIGIQELTSRMIDKMSNSSRLVEKLRKKELLERKECPEDRRSVDVVISEQGLALLKEIDSRIDVLMSEMGSITENEAQQLNELLDKLHD